MRTAGTYLRTSLALGLILAAVGSAGAQNLVKLYRLTELKADGGGESRAYAINETGQIVGWIDAGTNRHSAHWHNQVRTDLHGTVHFALAHPNLFDGEYSEAYAISDADQIVGGAIDNEKPCETKPYLYAYVIRPAVLSDLATPFPGDALYNLHTFQGICYDSSSTAISASGDYIAGWSDGTPLDPNDPNDPNEVIPNGFARIQGFVAYVNPTQGTYEMVEIGMLPGAGDLVSSATAVNNSGTVTGYSYRGYQVTDTGTRYDFQKGYHAFVLPVGAGGTHAWMKDDDGEPGNDFMRDLGTLGGINSWGRDINESDTVVGESDTDSDQTDGHYTRAFRIAPDGDDDGDGNAWFVDADGNPGNDLMVDLGTLASDGSGNSAASAINNNGQIVGWAENSDGQRRAFVYEDGEMKDLNDQLYLVNDLGLVTTAPVTLTEARDINDDGLIVGWGTARGSDGSAQTRGFLLTPIMVDPDAVVEVDEPETTTGGTPGVPGSSTGAPILGTPGTLGTAVLVPDPNSDTEPDAATAADNTGAVLCGTGAAAMVPLTIAGLWLMRVGTRRPSRR